MCGRYSTNEKVNDWITIRFQCMVDDVLRLGDIRPGEEAPVVITGRRCRASCR